MTSAPATYEQENIWALCQIFGSNSLVTAARFKLSGYIDYKKICLCLDKIISNQPSLRTVFHTVNGALWQKLLPGYHESQYITRLICDSDSEIKEHCNRILQ